MKNKSFATLGLLALLAATSAFGQMRVKADIPFEFHVGASVMPAGQYDLNQPSGHGPMSLGCYQCRAKMFVITYNVGGYYNPPAKGRLVFHRYGDTYFLSEVWSPDSGMGSALPNSKTEREVARSASLPLSSRIVLARQ